MERKTDAITPRQFISACRDLLSDRFLYNVFHISNAELLRYAADRDYVSDDYPRENPIEKFERILRKCVTVPGGQEIAESMVRRFAGIVGCRLVPEELPVPDKKNIFAECLDDLPARADYHAVLTNPKSSVDDIRSARAALDDELNQNEALLFDKKR